jgi:hypothetical protein
MEEKEGLFIPEIRVLFFFFLADVIKIGEGRRLISIVSLYTP